MWKDKSNNNYELTIIFAFTLLFILVFKVILDWEEVSLKDDSGFMLLFLIGLPALIAYFLNSESPQD